MSKTVEQVGRMDWTGNIVPANWFKTLKFDSGKPHVNAIIILSDIVYWYRPTEIRDENTGQLKGFKKKFKADKLQRGYAAFAEQFGLTKRQVKEAMDFLENERNVITREFRTVDTEAGKLNNVLFIDLNVEMLHQVTYSPTYPLLRSNVGGSYNETDHPPTLERGTNTKITTEITTKNPSSLDREDIGAHEMDVEPPSEPKEQGDGMPITVPGVQEEISPAQMLAKIEEHYLMRHGRMGFCVSPKDAERIANVIKSGIPFESIIEGIDIAFDTKVPEYEGDTIRNFEYCAQAIRRHHYEKMQRAKVRQDLERFNPDEAPAKPTGSTKPYIGGKKGYKNQRKDELPPLIVEQMERQQRMAAGEFNPSTGKASAEDTDAKKRRVQELLKEMGEVKA